MDAGDDALAAKAKAAILDLEKRNAYFDDYQPRWVTTEALKLGASIITTATGRGSGSGNRSGSAVDRESREYTESQNIALEFVNERCEREDGAKAFSKELYAAFVRWRKEGGVMKPESNQVFTRCCKTPILKNTVQTAFLVSRELKRETKKCNSAIF